MSQWWVRIRGRVMGPLTDREVRDRLNTNEFQGYLECSSDGMSWGRLDAVADFAAPDRPRKPVPLPLPDETQPPRERGGRRRRDDDEYEDRRPKSAGGGYKVLVGVLAGVLVIGTAIAVVLLVRGRGNADADGNPVVATRRSASESLPQIAQRLEPSVAVVRNRLGTGSGFVVGPGLIATNYHVIDDDLIENITVKFPSAPAPANGKEYKAKLVYENQLRDLALLQVDTDLPMLAVCKSLPLKGSPVIVIGSPGQSDGGTSVNQVNTGGSFNNLITFQDKKYVQINATVNPGNSGGPLFNENGEVLGVIVSKMVGKENMNMAIPFDDLATALEESRDVSDGTIRRRGAEHNVREVVQRLILAITIYKIAMEIYISNLRKAEDAKLSPAQLNALVSRVSKDVDARVQIDEKTLLGNFTLSYAGVVGHDSLDPSWRNHKDLQELREIFHRCKAKIQSSSVPPLGEYMQFFRKVDEDSERLIDSLLIQFGVDKKLMFRRISTYDLKVRELLK